jgi:flagellar biosynthesis protein FlhF
MRLRSFTAPTIADAMQLVRNELGGEAVILATQRLGTGKGVQVTAGMEMPDPRSEALGAGIGAIEAVDSVGTALEFHGLPPVIADRLLTAAADLLAEQPEMALAGALDAQFGFARLDTLCAGGKVMLVGMPGAGKTATIAKLAALARLENRAVVAVTCDVLRAGAVEQLATYASLLEMRAYRAKDPAALAAAIAAASPDALVLIDTIGSNPFDADEMSRLGEYIEAARVRPVLTLAAGGDVVESADCAAAFAELGAERLIATRIDAARRLGGVLSAAQVGRLSLAALGTSPQIASGLSPVNPVSLARLIMGADATAAKPSFAGAQPERLISTAGTRT